MTLPSVEQVYEALKPVVDPDIRLSIVDLGLIYDVVVEPTGKVLVKMTLTTPACPFGEQMVTAVHQAVQGMSDVTEVNVSLVWDPPWDPKERCSDQAKDVLGIW